MSRHRPAASSASVFAAKARRACSSTANYNRRHPPVPAPAVPRRPHSQRSGSDAAALWGAGPPLDSAPPTEACSRAPPGNEARGPRRGQLRGRGARQLPPAACTARAPETRNGRAWHRRDARSRPRAQQPASQSRARAAGGQPTRARPSRERERVRRATRGRLAEAAKPTFQSRLLGRFGAPGRRR